MQISVFKVLEMAENILHILSSVLCLVSLCLKITTYLFWIADDDREFDGENENVAGDGS